MCMGNVFKAYLLYRKSIAILKDEMLSSVYFTSNHPEPIASSGMPNGLPTYCRNQQYILRTLKTLAITM